MAVIRYHLGLDEEQRRVHAGPIDYDGPAVRHGPVEAYMEVIHG